MDMCFYFLWISAACCFFLVEGGYSRDIVLNVTLTLQKLMFLVTLYRILEKD